MTELLERLGRSIRIPTLPQVATRLTAMVNDPDVGMREVGAVLAQDPPLTATVLRYANGAAYGLRNRVASAEDAATVLGARALRNLTLQAAVIDGYEHLTADAKLGIRSYWEHSVLVAHLTRRLAFRHRAQRPTDPDEAYTCGLLHDLGRMVLLDNLRGGYVELVAEASEDGTPLHVAERKALRFTHMDLGRNVVRNWNLPDTIEAAVMRHHEPASRQESFDYSDLTRLADELAHAVEAIEPVRRHGGEAREEVAQALGVPLKEHAEVIEYALAASTSIEI